MVIFETRDGIEYVIKEKGSITVDNPLGAILYKRAEKQRHNPFPSKININGRRRTYEGLMDDFESGQMTRETYEALLKRMTVLSITDEKNILKSRQIMKTDLIKYLFGDIKKLPEQQRELLTKSAVSVKSFKKFIQSYIISRTAKLPIDLKPNKIRILEKFNSKPLKDLERELATLKNVVNFRTDFKYLGPTGNLDARGDKTLTEKFREANRIGSVFDLGDVLGEFQHKYGL